MMTKTDIKSLFKNLGMRILTNDWDDILKKANKTKPSYYNFMKSVMEKEYADKCERARLARIRRAKIPEVYIIDTFPFRKQPRLNKKVVYGLHDSLDFVKENQDLILIGPTGCGKTGLATSFLMHAINKGYKGRFFDFKDLINHLYQSRGDHTDDKCIKKLMSFDILLIDELGYISCEEEQGGLFFDLMRKRHKKKTTIITTQLGFDEWNTFLPNDHLTAALLDRITVNCAVFNMKKCISIREKKIVYATNRETK
jgi:DNA replication protein DnaC